MYIIRSAVFIAVTALLVSCSGGGGGGTPSPQPTPQPVNSAPTADAGIDFSSNIDPSGIALDGSGSSDPENQTLAFDWAILSQPSNANGSLDSSKSANPVLNALIPGEYVVELTVTDTGGLSATDRLTVTILNQLPIVTVDPFQSSIETGTPIELSAIGSSDADGHSLSFVWDIISAPANSAMDMRYTGISPLVTFDKNGEYVFQLSVSDGYDTSIQTLDAISASDFATINIGAAYTLAAFHSDSETIVGVSELTLTKLSANGAETSLLLPSRGTAINISFDGTQAVIAHESAVSHVDLGSMQVLGTYDIGATVHDIAYGPKEFVIVSTTDASRIGSVLYVDLTDAGAIHSDGNVNSAMKLRMHPSGSRVYGADANGTPDDFFRYDITAKNISFAFDSRYHGTYGFCGGLWNGPRGETLLSKCGFVFRTTNAPESDIVFAHTFQNGAGGYIHASSSAFSNTWYAIKHELYLQPDESQGIERYDAETGEELQRLPMPEISSVSSDTWTPRFVFASQNSAKVLVIAEDTTASTPTFALLKRGNETSGASNLSPVALTSKYNTGYVGIQLGLNARDSFDPEGEQLNYTWTLVSKPNGSNAQLVLADREEAGLAPDIPGTYQVSLVVNDGVRDSQPYTTFLNAFANGTNLVHRLEGKVTDIEYNRSKNTAVYVVEDSHYLHIVNLTNFSERKVKLPRLGYQVSIAPSGTFAAVSHNGSATLVDIPAAEVVDTQDYSAYWGDIVLDDSNTAYISPRRGSWANFQTVDFANDTAVSAFGIWGSSWIRLHPNGQWVYAANRNSSPDDIYKWDVTTRPASLLGDSPYTSEYTMGGDLWINETGSSIMVATGNLFRSTSSNNDMTIIGRLQNLDRLAWANHHEAEGLWAVLDHRSWADTVRSGTQIYLYNDTSLGRTKTISLEDIPNLPSPGVITASQVHFTLDGNHLVAMLMAESGTDTHAIMVAPR